MDHTPVIANFPVWLRMCHWVNVLFITLLMRSGVQILFDLPKLYWNDNCMPGSEWIKFGKKVMPKDRLWTSHDEAEWVSPVIALPGGFHTVGPARAWHFFCVIFWVFNGLIYVTLLFATNEWHRLIPDSWDIIPRAWHTFTTYMTFHLPPASEFRPYDPLQQIAYAGVIFILAPLAMITGPLQSPAVNAHFPRLITMLGGRQRIRSVHFLVLVAYVIFLIIHVSLVVITDPVGNMNHIVLGTDTRSTEGIYLGLLIVAAIIGFHIAATIFTTKHPRKIQHTIGHVAEYVIAGLLSRVESRQTYSKEEISPYFRVNGRPPGTEEWLKLKEHEFKDFKLPITGLVEHELALTYDDLKALPNQTQITKHHCVQGWTAIAEWRGVPLTEIIRLCRPLPNAKFLLFHSFQFDATGNEFYGTITLEDAKQAQTILAYEMNGEPLPEQYGAPLRLRVETYVGFKMTKWIKSIEVIDDFSKIFGGQGGYREDQEFHVNLPRV